MKRTDNVDAGRDDRSAFLAGFVVSIFYVLSVLFVLVTSLWWVWFLFHAWGLLVRCSIVEFVW
jgi:hypothetical protein